MTREEAIRELKADYCGNRIICELHPDQCNREDCEIWLAIKALETKPDGDVISRQAAIRILDAAWVDGTEYQGHLHERFEKLPSAQPDITPDGTLNVSIDADIANVGRILLSQTGTQRGGLYYKDAEPEQGDFEKQLHDMFDHIWNCEIDHPVFQDTVGDLMRAVIEAHYRATQPEIIRCRDCKHRDPEDKKCDCGHAIVWNLPRQDDWFCADAKRRTDGTEQP